MKPLRALCRIAVVSVIAVTASIAGLGAPAGAGTTTIGQLAGVPFPCAASIDAVQASVTNGTSYTVPPGDWSVTAWSTQAGGGETPGSLQLEIWRPTATVGQFTLVGISPVATTSAPGTNTFPLVAPIAVQGGDLLGLRNLTEGYGCVEILAGGATFAGVNGAEPTPGEVRTLPSAPDARLNITATLHTLMPELQVEKVVVGTAPGGFVARVQCIRDSTKVADVLLAFLGDGTPDAASAPAGWIASADAWHRFDDELAGSHCFALETVNGDASSVSYECAWTPGESDHVADVGCPGESGGPTAKPIPVTFEGGGDVGRLTITNTFPETPSPPPVAPPITIAPKFTG